MVSYCEGSCKVICGFREDKEKMKSTIEQLKKEGWELVSSEYFKTKVVREGSSWKLVNASWKYMMVKY